MISRGTRSKTRAARCNLERFIHGGIYEIRPEVIAVVHAHAEDILPYSISSGTPLRPVIHSGSFIGANVPVWDIADRFGDTNLLVTNMDQGRDLAGTLGGDNVALMRGHGFVAAARSLIEVVRISVYLPRNARALTTALLLGGSDQAAVGRGDRRANQKALQPLFAGDVACLGILGEQVRLRTLGERS